MLHFLLEKYLYLAIVEYFDHVSLTVHISRLLLPSSAAGER